MFACASIAATRWPGVRGCRTEIGWGHWIGGREKGGVSGSGEYRETTDEMGDGSGPIEGEIGGGDTEGKETGDGVGSTTGGVGANIVVN